ncbi:MAG: ethanolamine ammonia-lyase subunit EutC [Deltaproteobacteria bacterium]|nr:ethanolamine ammonia-lyase subunit EutC [Deltaproteobacteria bacterium]
MTARPDPWADLRSLTRARIALGRAGGSLPTAEWLGFSAAHAAARDAVWAELDLDRLDADLGARGLGPSLRLASQAPDRATYLRRPDLGRRLDAASAARLAAAAPAGGCDVALLVGDGLSAGAAQGHAPALAAALAARLRARGLALGPVAAVRQARVAVQDPVGQALGARAAVVLLGERPGLGAPESLGAYLVLGPRPGRTDAERNCVSNVRPEGMPVEGAADLLAWLTGEALWRGLSGVGLKDERGLLGP